MKLYQSNIDPDDPKIKVMLQAAKRANWQALYGPPHMRTGRYNPVPEASKPINKADPPESKPAD